MPCPFLEDVERYEINTPVRWAYLVKAWRCKGLHRVQGLPDRAFQHGKVMEVEPYNSDVDLDYTMLNA